MKTKSLEEKLQRVMDFQEIQNIMGRFAYVTMASDSQKRADLFAKKVPDVRVYFAEQGYYEGPDAPLKGAWGPKTTPPGAEDPRTGSMALSAPVCPVIEIAGDGKTAKGVWIGIGLMALKNRETKEPLAMWEVDKFGVDFIKEDEVWKIWHFHLYSVIRGWNVDEKFAEQFTRKNPAPSVKLDGPSVDHNPYTPDTMQQLIPKPPEPYETWVDTTMY